MSSLDLGARICSVLEDHGKPVVISEADRQRPLYMIGKPATGKSNLLEHCIEQDIKAGHGLVFIEPDYNLTPYLLSHIPPERIPHTLLIDFADRDFPIPLNGLDTSAHPTVDDLHRITATLMSITREFWADNWSATRMSRLFLHLYTALVEYPDTTLLSIPRFLEDKDYRKQIVPHISNLATADFWQRFETKPERYKTESAEPILNRIEQLFISPFMRNILCQPKNTFDLADLVQNNGIIIVNLARTQNGRDEAGVLGSLFLSRLYHTALHLESSNPFTFYLDDFTEYALPVFPANFSQSRHLRFVLAHQYLGQLTKHPHVKDAIFGSAGTIVTFQTSNSDAQILDKELDTDPNDIHIPKLTHMPNYHALVKQHDDPFYISTYPPQEPHHGHKQAIIDHTRTTYATPRKDVETYIKDWYSRTPPPDDMPHTRFS